MRYEKINGIHIVEVPVKDFKLIMNDSRKKTAAPKNYCNAGFFAGYDESSVHFTLPVAHLVCDFDSDCKWTRHYCEERGKFKGDKFFFDSYNWSYQNQFYQKSVSSLIINDGFARIEDIAKLPSDCDYVISGVPIMRDGKDVKFNTYVKSQGWGSGSLYATYHNFIGLKSEKTDVIYLMAMKTTTSNMILTAEAYNKFKKLGFYDVIKLDGGGSQIMDVEGSRVMCSSENRHINSIITFGELEVEKKEEPKEPVKAPVVNPYKMPSTTLRKGSSGTGVKWLQFQLNELGYNCGAVDGIFGTNTRKAVLKFQDDRNIDVDGLVGPATRRELLK